MLAERLPLLRPMRLRLTEAEVRKNRNRGEGHGREVRQPSAQPVRPPTVGPLAPTSQAPSYSTGTTWLSRSPRHLAVLTRIR